MLLGAAQALHPVQRLFLFPHLRTLTSHSFPQAVLKSPLVKSWQLPSCLTHGWGLGGVVTPVRL